ncbi:MAG TPA: PAS domain S-box protein [Deltaproteobacteria bacterium]|nr:PAS domain S-box protein [Deltaproteobacteria bacterium]
MSLKNKIAIILILIMAVSSMVYFAVFKFIVLKGFIEAETGDALHDMNQCISVLTLETKHLDNFVHDWSSWDSTYSFVENRNQEFIDENLMLAVYLDQGISLIHIYNNEGALVWGKTYDLETEEELPFDLEQELEGPLFSRIVSQKDPEGYTSGIIQTSIGPMVVASHPILTSENQGPSNGAMVMGRVFTKDSIVSLSELAGVELDAWAVRDKDMPDTVRSLIDVLNAPGSVRIEHASPDILHAYSIIRDIADQPAIILKASFPRLITQRGARAHIIGLVFILGTGLLVFVSISWIFRVYVLNPIARLTDSALAVDESRSDLTRFKTDRLDEIGILSRELAGMLERLSRSEEKYRQLTETAHDCIVSVDFDFTITYANRASYLFAEGIDPVGKNLLDFTPEHLHELQRAIIQKRKKGFSDTLAFQWDIIHPKGEKSTYDIRSTLLTEQGNPSGVLFIARDITERQRTEEKIRKSEERYRTIFESTATANIIVAEDSTILMANNDFADLCGYSKQELEGNMSWTVFIHSDDLARMKTYHQKRRTDPESAPSSYEFRAINRRGEVLNLLLSTAVIPETNESIVSMIDISAWKRSEQAKIESEARFKELAELLPETVYEADKDGVFLYVNKTGFEKFGYTCEDINTGKSVFDMIIPVDHPRMIATYERLAKGEQVGLGEYTARRKDGSTFPALVHATAIFHEGKPVGHRGFVIDISEKKNLEDQLIRAQKLEAIGTLAGGIAHDFNNLLMGILGSISLILMQTDQKNPIHDRLKSIEEYVQRGSDLTKQLLGFARGGKYEVRPTDLGEFTRESSELFGRTKKEIRIHHKAHEGLWTVEVDRGQIEQVLLNLYVNAWHAMPHGGDLYLSVENVELDSVSVRPYEIEPGRFVKVTVTDTGTGMDEATKSRIFEPFFTTKERGRGTGLGLASAYGIIKNHGGFINVESERNVGTTFMIYLPASVKPADISPVAKEELSRGKETILLIDDEEMILEVSAKMLEQLGYHVIVASGGKMGVQTYKQNRDRIDLVILDMVMPDLSGKESFDELIRIDPEVKVLLSSGYSLGSQAEEIMQKGCRGFIQKPFTLTVLSGKIREILEKG